MPKIRIIPVLSIAFGRMVKTLRFTDPIYLGDPVNILRIFNCKQVDEICVVDITSTRDKQAPDYSMIQNMVSECFMPLCYGGGIKHLSEMEHIYGLGVEKISLNSLLDSSSLVEEAAKKFGNQSLVASIDVIEKDGTYQLFDYRTRQVTPLAPEEQAKRCESMGCGEILLNCVNRDGVRIGYDLELIRRVSTAVSIPVIACGGANTYDDLGKALLAGASAAGAGSLFTLYGKHRAVLLRYPNQKDFEKIEAIIQ
jgi:cyclase